MVKCSEQRTKLLLTRSGSSLKIKFTHSFLTLRSEGGQCKDCFPQLGTALRLVFGASLSFGVHLSCKHYMHESVGGAKPGRDVEAGVDLLLWRQCLSIV